jgi:hypothetical protein
MKVIRDWGQRCIEPAGRMRPVAMVVPRIRTMNSNGIIKALRVRTGIVAYPAAVAGVRSISSDTVMRVGSLD